MEEENSNSFIYVIISIMGGLMAFGILQFPASTNPMPIVLVEFLALGTVIFACSKKTGIIPCLAVVWVLFCILIFVYSLK